MLKPLNDTLDWPRQFEKTYGRPLRVLHLGNVANYAYVNAKLQRRIGIDAVVMDPDFYHIMAAPEWLDSDFEGHAGDDFYPQWHKVDLKGFKRPEWFVQGPMDLCLDYLLAKNAGNEAMARVQRQLIDIYRRVNSRPKREDDTRKTTTMTSKEPTFLQKLTNRDAILSQIRKVYVKGRKVVKRKPRVKFDRRTEFKGDRTMSVKVHSDNWARFLSVYGHFDIVQGYTASGLSPLAAGHPNVVAYELGTIRGLPFEDSDFGRTVKWLYQNAPGVVVTNIDCVDAADRLGIEEEDRVLALHAYDVDAAVNFSKAPLPCPIDTTVPLFFAPARHHWRDGNLSWLKGNDVLIKGAAKAAERGYKFQLVFIDWGQEVALSKELISECGLEDRVTWLTPRPSKRLWPIYCAATAIIDQFRASAFGGVALESLALGRRLITSYDNEASSAFFKENPPILNVRTEDKIADAIMQCLEDRDDEKRLGQRAQQWFCEHHSVARQMAPQFELYRKLMDAHGVAPTFSRAK